MNNFPCYERCSGAVAGGQRNLPAVYDWFTNNLPTVGTKNIAYANFYPALKLDDTADDSCRLRDGQEGSVQHIKESMKALLETGYVPYLCTFSDAWFRAYLKTYKTDSGKWNLIRQERKRQTRCETGLLKDLLEEDESMDFVWREKANCVSAVRRELANPMPPLIPVAAWTSETPI